MVRSDQLPGYRCEGTCNSVLRAIKGRATHDVWAVGDNAIVHYDGKTWHTLALPTNDGNPYDLLSFKDIEFGPAGEVWLTADYHIAPGWFGGEWKTGSLVFRGR